MSTISADHGNSSPDNQPAGNQPAGSPSKVNSPPVPGISTLVWRSLRAFRALHLALALGIAAATAVILGALVVGDSVRGSLQQIVIQRLGKVHSVMLSQRFFSSELLAADSTTPLEGYQLLPVIILPGSAAELKHASGLRRAANVQVLGVNNGYWPAISDSSELQSIQLSEDQVAVSAALASELGLQLGDELTIRLPKGSGVPADSPLGRRDDAAASLPRQRVVAILPARSVADLEFRVSQQPSRNLFVSAQSLQEVLGQPERVNGALLVTTGLASQLNQQTTAEAQLVCDQLNARITPALADYGLKLTRNRRTFPDASLGESSDASDPNAAPQTIFDYYQISSEQLIIDNLTLTALMNELQLPVHQLNPRRSLVYLVNEIRGLNAQGVESPPVVTYSICAGLEDWETTLPIAQSDEGLTQMRPNACGINAWLAKQLNVQLGDMIRVKHFRPETIEGQEVETTTEFQVVAIVANSEPAKGYSRNRPAVFINAPTAANDPGLTPVVPGITDQDTISDWDLPFKLTREIPKDDDNYWRDHRLTPKLFLRYNLAVRHFGSRFGNATSIHLDAATVEGSMGEAGLRRLITQAMLRAKAGLGMQLIPLRALQLQAAAGTTPFDGLFLALSFFVIVSALMLVALLFRLSIEQRATHWGLLLASGFQQQRVRQLLLMESLWVIGLGIGLGGLAGLGYAWLMITGLQSWWVGAISGSFLNYYVTPKSLMLGGAIGGLTSLVTIAWSLRRLARSTPLGLLRGRSETQSWSQSAASKAAMGMAGFLFFGAVGLTLLGFTLTGMAQAGAFFGSGMTLVVAALAAAVYLLHRSPAPRAIASTPAPSNPATHAVDSRSTPHTSPLPVGIGSLAWSTLQRNLWRSVLTLGLLSVASFLIASMSVFQISPTLQGSGGFELIGESSLPIYRDPSTIRAREEILSTADFDQLRTVNILSFRQRPGEDASCNNLFQVAQPTILGVPDMLHQQQQNLPEDQRFQFVASDFSEETPWQSLARAAMGTELEPIPVIIDMNTAAWSLHQGAALGAITKIQMDDRVIHFRTVGLLSNSIMQGKLLIGEFNFSQLFPEISGYRYFLIHDDQKDPQVISDAMENGWSDQGLDVTASAEVLEKLLAVQNTYISAFQAIGALGLLLGTIGLAVVQVRSVLERRRELALMQALGFPRSRLAQLLLTESSMLLVGGLIIGVLSAALALIPYMISNRTTTDYAQPLTMLAIVLVVGFLASLIAVIIAMRQPLLKNIQ